MKTIIGNNMLSKINTMFDFSRFSKILILTDSNVSKNWLTAIKDLSDKKQTK